MTAAPVASPLKGPPCLTGLQDAHTALHRSWLSLHRRPIHPEVTLPSLLFSGSNAAQSTINYNAVQGTIVISR